MTLSYWRGDLDFEHGHSESVPHGVIVGWQNVEMYSVRPVDQACNYVSIALASWESLLTNRLLLVQTPHIFLITTTWNRMLSSDHALLPLFAVSTAVQFLSLACGGVSDTFDLDSRLLFSPGCLAGIENSLEDLIGQANICSIVHGSDFDTASSVFSWRMMRGVD